MQDRLLLSEKYKAFLRCGAPVEVMEGTTYGGKTTVGAFKFVLKVARSKKKLHVLSAKNTGIAEKNIINKQLGLLDNFGDLLTYYGNGSSTNKIPHLVLHAEDGDKIIYVMGYEDRQRWQTVLGGQYGCVYIDEVNTANIDYVREISMRCDYLLMTLNPDDNGLPIYSEYINHSRPLPEWADDMPDEIRQQLCEEEKPGWTHWFFSFKDNPALTPDKLAAIKGSVPRGTKIWKNKIEGIRGRATGLVFSVFEPSVHVKPAAWARQYVAPSDRQAERFIRYTAGLDTAYSSRSPDTIAMCYAGITDRGRYVLLDCQTYNNKGRDTPLAPSDTIQLLADFLSRCSRAWGPCRAVYIDSADQATITEAQKWKRRTGCLYDFVPAWKKMPVVDRLTLQSGWMAHEGKDSCFYVLDTCRDYIDELNVYSWRDDRDLTPEDGHDHCINACQYSWLPYVSQIGTDMRTHHT